MGTAIICNIILILAIATMVGILVGTGSRTGEGLGGGIFSFLWTTTLLLGLSVTGWIIYVAVHFIQKFW